MRKLLWALVSVGLVGTIAIILVFSVLESDVTSQWMVRQIGPQLLPGKLAMNNIQGDLLSEITIDDIQYDTGPQQMEIQHLRLRCSPLALFTGKLQIDSLDIKKVSFTITEDIKTAHELIESGLVNVNIPVAIAADRLSIAEFILNLSSRRLVAQNVNLKGSLRGNRMSIADFETQVNRFRIGFNGEVTLAAPFSYEGRLRWRSALTKALENVGACTLNGDLDQMKVDIAVREPFSILTAGVLSWEQNAFTFSGIKPSDSQPGDPKFDSKFPTDASIIPGMVVNIDGLQAKTLHGEVTLNGRVIWQDEPAWDLVLKANQINPASRFQNWPGELSLQAMIRGRLISGTPQLSIPDFTLDGQLLDQPIHAEGHIDTLGEQLSAVDLKIVSGANVLSLKTGETSGNDVQFDFTVRDPYSLWPPFKGTFTGTGTVKDLYGSPQVSLRINGTGIRYAAAAVKNMRVDADITLNDSPTSTARIAVNGIQLGDSFYPKLSVSTSGGLDHQQVSGTIQSTQSQLDFKVSGTASNDQWSFIAEDASLSSTVHGPWKLAEPATIRLDRDKMVPFSACWEQAQLSRCIDVDWRFDDGLKIDGDQEIPPYQFISVFTQKLLESREKKSPDV